MNLERFARWSEEYRQQLQAAVNAKPTEYAFRPEHAPQVAARILTSMAASGAHNAPPMFGINKDGRAMKATCKALGLKHTYTAINAYLRGEETPQ